MGVNSIYCDQRGIPIIHPTYLVLDRVSMVFLNKVEVPINGIVICPRSVSSIYYFNEDDLLLENLVVFEDESFKERFRRKVLQYP